MNPASVSTPQRIAVAWLLAALLVAGCAPSPRFLERRLYAMGTWVDIAVVATPRTAEAALGEAEAMLRRFEVDYYAWAEGGELARVNRAFAAGKETTTSPEMAALLTEAKRLTSSSRGAFDPGVGALVELWGFHSALSEEPRFPDPVLIEEWLRTGASLAAVDIDDRRVRTSVPATQIDLGGIAKGEAVDRLIDLLRRHGIRHAMVNAGGDLRVLGNRNGRPWRIGIQNPRADGVLGVIELEDGEAAFTSGDYERYFDSDGRRLHHILDPRSGYPADATRAITVIADRGVHADAAATGLFVAGDDWRRLANDLEVEAVLRVDAAGEVEATDALHRRLVPGTAERWNVG